MDPTEELVFEHLAYRGYANIVYEPNGNVPPDFRVDNNIAIEVRRLNQNHFNGTATKGLEEVAIPLWNKVEKLVGSLGAPMDGESWFVSFRFTRPVESWKTLKPVLRNALQTFAQSTNKQKGLIAESKGFEIDVFRASKPHATMFVMGGYFDKDANGWFLPKMKVNIQYCASEKYQKIAKVRPEYTEWWLALVDHIGYGIVDDLDREMLREQLSIEHGWDKILIIDMTDHKKWFEI